MDRLEYWVEYAKAAAPFFGLVGGAWALPLGMESLSAGLAFGSVGGYLASVGAFGAGYVLARRSWEGRTDRLFGVAFAVLIVVSIYVLGFLHTPLNVFQQIGRW